MTNIAAVLCVRMSSERLPGKPLVVYDPAGKPNIECLVERVSTSRHAPRIIIATSTHSSDDAIEGWFSSKKYESGRVSLFRGDLENVVGRMGNSISQLFDSAELVWRVMGDNPLVDIGLVDHRIDVIKRYDADMVVPILPEPTYAAQSNVWSREAWEFCRKSSSGSLMFHPGEYLYENSSQFKTIRDPGPTWEYYQDIRTELDTPEDLEFFRRVYSEFPEIANFVSYRVSADGERWDWAGRASNVGYGTNTRKVLGWLKDHPEIVALNSHIQMKTSTTYLHGHPRARNIRCESCHSTIANKVNERIDLKCPKCGTTKQFYM